MAMTAARAGQPFHGHSRGLLGEHSLQHLQSQPPLVALSQQVAPAPDPTPAGAAALALLQWKHELEHGLRGLGQPLKLALRSAKPAMPGPPAHRGALRPAAMMTSYRPSRRLASRLLLVVNSQL